MGIGANRGGGASGVHGFYVLTCSEAVIAFPLFAFSEFHPHTSHQVCDSCLGFGEV